MYFTAPFNDTQSAELNQWLHFSLLSTIFADLFRKTNYLSHVYGFALSSGFLSISFDCFFFFLWYVNNIFKQQVFNVWWLLLIYDWRQQNTQSSIVSFSTSEPTCYWKVQQKIAFASFLCIYFYFSLLLFFLLFFLLAEVYSFSASKGKIHWRTCLQKDSHRKPSPNHWKGEPDT